MLVLLSPNFLVIREIAISLVVHSSLDSTLSKSLIRYPIVFLALHRAPKLYENVLTLNQEHRKICQDQDRAQFWWLLFRQPLALIRVILQFLGLLVLAMRLQSLDESKMVYFFHFAP